MSRVITLEISDDLEVSLRDMASIKGKTEEGIALKALETYLISQKLKEIKPWFSKICGELADRLKVECGGRKGSGKLKGIKEYDTRLTQDIGLPSSKWGTGFVRISYLVNTEKFRCSIMFQIDRQDRNEIEWYSERLHESGLDYMISYPDCFADLYCEQKVPMKTIDDFDLGAFFQKMLNILNFYQKLRFNFNR